MLFGRSPLTCYTEFMEAFRWGTALWGGVMAARRLGSGRGRIVRAQDAAACAASPWCAVPAAQLAPLHASHPAPCTTQPAPVHRLTPCTLCPPFVPPHCRAAFEPELGGLIAEVVVGLGPCGELRYPSYLEAHGWRFPGIGEFQCYDRRALASLAAAACAAGRADWGYTGPHDSGGYNSAPEDTGFFAGLGGSWDSEYGRFFLAWYSSCLLAHGERVLSVAARVFGPYRSPRGGWLAGQLGGLMRRLQSLLLPQPGSPTGSTRSRCSGSPSAAACTPLSLSSSAGALLRAGGSGHGGTAFASSSGSLAAEGALEGAGGGVCCMPPVTEEEGVSGSGTGAAALAPLDVVAQLLQGRPGSPLSQARDLVAALLAPRRGVSFDGGGGAAASADGAAAGSLSACSSRGGAGEPGRSPRHQQHRLHRPGFSPQRYASAGMLAETSAEAASAQRWAAAASTVSLGSLSSDCCIGGGGGGGGSAVSEQGVASASSSGGANASGGEVCLDEVDSAAGAGAAASATLQLGGGANNVVPAPGSLSAAVAAAMLDGDGWARSPRSLLASLVGSLSGAQLAAASGNGLPSALAGGGALHGASGGLSLSMKVAGVHWWYNSRSHASELTAGYYNTVHRDGYRPILELAARHGACVTLTCMEMCDSQHPSGAKCGPEGLLRQVRCQAADLGVPLAGENALPIFSPGGVDSLALDRIVHNTRPWAASSYYAAPHEPPGPGGGMRRANTLTVGLAGLSGDGDGGAHAYAWPGVNSGRNFTPGGRCSSTPICRASGGSSGGGDGDGESGSGSLRAGSGAVSRLSRMRGFTFLRLGPELLQPEFRALWLQFVARMRAAAS